MKKFMRLGVVGLFAFGLGLAPALVGVSVAKADDPSPVIDTSKKAKLTIHKFVKDGFGADNATGNKIDDESTLGTPVAGVKFKIEKFKVDNFATPAGITTARSLTPENIKDTGMKDTSFTDLTLTTSEGGAGKEPVGTISKDNLDLGVYLVSEVPDPKLKVDGKSLVPAAPFLVMLPMTDPSDHSKWNYDVHVYPKNQKTGSSKTVQDADVQAGQTLSFNISGDVPPVDDGKTLELFTIEDTLDKEKLEPVTEKQVDSDPENDPKNGVTKVVVSTSPETVLVKNTDYTVEYEPGTQKYTITLTSTGLKNVETLTSKASGFQVTATILAKVKPVGSGDGKIENTATVTTNNGSGGGKVKTETNTTTTYHGKLKIHKENATKTPLGGAVFELYKCGEDGKTQGNKISVNGATSWKTAAGTGEVTIDGLHVTDFADDAEKTAFEYCLVETEAPEGYELLPAPIKVTFTKEDVFGASVPTKGLKTVTVENVPSTTPWLPMTGGPGIILLVIAGIAIIAGGSVYGLRSRKATK